MLSRLAAMKIALPLACLLLLAACTSGTGTGGGTGGSAGGAAGGTGGTGGGSGGGTGGGGGLVALDAFCGVFAIKSCDHLKTCGQLADAQVAECRASREARCRANARATDAGALRFDAVAATACIASTYNPPCYSGPEDLYDCLDDVFQVGGKIGSPCEDGQCIEGFCPAGFGVCRACTPYFAPGASCSQFNSCNPSTGYCPQTGAGRKCEPLLAPGGECFTGLECAGRATCVNFGPIDGGISRCGPVALGSACASAGDCGTGAYCKGLRIASDNTITLGVCAARLALNSPCGNEQYDDGCSGTAATCLDGKCVTTQPHTRPLNAECDAYNQCPVGAYCTCAGVLTNDGGISLRDGTCQPQQGANGFCWEEEQYSMCLPGLDCLAQGVCAAFRTEGQTCGPSVGQCRQFLTCTQGLCVAARKAGEPCADVTLPCATGNFCLADAGAAMGACAPLRAAGAACTNDVECATARCADADGGKVCATCP